ncbi:hypothetical protein ACKKBG_A08520 [Auxenochlorella protothecoides x Auxenochlorella symbiontica]
MQMGRSSHPRKCNPSTLQASSEAACRDKAEVGTPGAQLAQCYGLGGSLHSTCCLWQRCSFAVCDSI